MADELMLQYTVPGGPRDVMAGWRGVPPAWVTDYEYELVDEAIDTLVYERHESHGPPVRGLQGPA